MSTEASRATQFKAGHSSNGGRPKGSRNKLSEAFLRVLADDFEVHGSKVIEGLRVDAPGQYCQVIGRLMPKLMELSGPDGEPIDLTWKVNVTDPSEAETTAEPKPEPDPATDADDQRPE